ncbi:fungal specific transcription factor domain-containing protein [Verticillium dahliae]
MVFKVGVPGLEFAVFSLEGLSRGLGLSCALDAFLAGLLAPMALGPVGRALCSGRQMMRDRPSVGFDPDTSTEPDSELAMRGHGFEDHSGSSTVSGPDEEPSLLQSTRILQHPTGRLLYVGDSASLAYLQLIRMIVETRTGPIDFTLEPSRHKFMEATINMPTHIRSPLILPEKETANILITSFLPIRPSFEASVDACYSDPLPARSSFLWLLYLTFAIGWSNTRPSARPRPDRAQPITHATCGAGALYGVGVS